MQKQEPFGFFVDHASAFVGLGGQEPSPDPRYCFHTPYQSVPAGRAEFQLALDDVVAQQCELNVRVMAFRPGDEAMMATSIRIDLDYVDGAGVRRTLRFLAVRDVQYALYGYLSDAKDLLVQQVETFAFLMKERSAVLIQQVDVFVHLE